MKCVFSVAPNCSTSPRSWIVCDPLLEQIVRYQKMYNTSPQHLQFFEIWPKIAVARSFVHLDRLPTSSNLVLSQTDNWSSMAGRCAPCSAPSDGQCEEHRSATGPYYNYRPVSIPNWSDSFIITLLGTFRHCHQKITAFTLRGSIQGSLSRLPYP